MDIPWKIFESCWHSFHLSCLDVVDTCPICRKGIEDEIKYRSSAANTGSVDSVSNGGMEGTAGNEMTMMTMMMMMNFSLMEMLI